MIAHSCGGLGTMGPVPVTGKASRSADSRLPSADPGPVRRRKQQLAREVWQLQRRLFRYERPHFDSVIAVFDLTATDYRALESLKPGTMQSMGTLAERWACDPSTVTWIIRRVERKGLVSRETIGSDRRVRMVGLTPAGALLRRQVLEALEAPPDFLLELSADDLITFLAVLHKLHLPALE
jgi:MarR family transcriptional regulator, organic hydroperoxide resistance regulator